MQDREFDGNLIQDALTAVGELLAAEDARATIVVTGGATLNLLGIVQRTTGDVDVIARARQDENGSVRLDQPEPFPPALDRAVRTVARDLGLATDWMNAEVGSQWSQGLPPWIMDEIEWRNYGGALDVGLVGRRTLVSLKLFAAVDQGRESVHFQDLLRLGPDDSELEEARSWVVEQDAAPGWSEAVDGTIADVKRNR